MARPAAAAVTRRLAWLRADDGSVVATAITFPVVMLLLIVIMQASLYFAARSAANSAAQQGVTTGRAQGATAAQGQAAACHYATTAAKGILRSPSCTATGGNTITITVCGDAPNMLPGFPDRVCEQQKGPRERFTTP